MSIISQTSLASSTTDILVPNQVCDPAVVVGNWVRWNGTTLVPALADSTVDSNIYGLVESKQSSTIATVRVAGVSAAIFTGLDNSVEYFLSDSVPGGMNPQGVNVPTGSGHIILSLGKPVTTDRFLVRPGTRIRRA